MKNILGLGIGIGIEIGTAVFLLALTSLADSSGRFQSLLALIEPGETEVELQSTSAPVAKVFQQKCGATGCGVWNETQGILPTLKFRKYEIWEQEITGIQVHQTQVGVEDFPLNFQDSILALESKDLQAHVLGFQIRVPAIQLGVSPIFEAIINSQMADFGPIFPSMQKNFIVEANQPKCEEEGFAKLCHLKDRWEIVGLAIGDFVLDPGTVTSMDPLNHHISVEFASGEKISSSGNFSIRYKLNIIFE